MVDIVFVLTGKILFIIIHIKEISMYLKLKNFLKEVNIILFAFLLKYFMYNISGGNATTVFIWKR